MTEQISELFIYEKSRLKESIIEVDSYLNNPEVVEALKQSVQVVANQIVELYASNTDKEFNFVVGGKSRRVTERMLQHVTNALPEGHPARKAIKDRLRLNDQQNKNLYGENTSTQTEAKKVDLSPLEQLTGKNKETELCIYIT